MKCNKGDVKRLLTDTIFLFLTGALIGWLYEVILHIFTDGFFVNRGMLHGPWLPIYGIGCLVMVGLKKANGKRPVSYFLISMGACGVLEYMTSWAFEAIYHARWWDYSDCPFNLNGRIFLGGLIGFGAAGCLFVFALLPLLERLYRQIPKARRYRIAIVLIAVFLVDLLISMIAPNAGIGITSY